MVQPNSLVADAAGTQNTMSDIIDSLKRLERVGSENSKTTQKLITAATELSRLIVKQFAIVGSERVEVVRPRPAEANASALYEPSCPFNYWIEQGRLHYFSGRSGPSRVDETRDDALEFSKDIAKGLLDYIIEALEERTAESAEGLAAIEGAVNKLNTTRKQ